MPDVEREPPWVPELLPADAPGTASLLLELATHLAQQAARLPVGFDLRVRTRDAIDEPDDPVHDSPARRAARWGATSNMISALWDPEAFREISPTGRTLLHVTAAAPIEKAVPEIIDKLVRKGVPLDAQERLLGNTALHLAVERFVNTPVSDQCDDRYQRRAMFRRIERLLAHGANPKVPNVLGHTALHQVFCQRGLGLLGHPVPWPLIDQLMRAGADPDLPSRVGVTARALLDPALRRTPPAETPGARKWWLQNQAPALYVDHDAHRVAREAVALRLNFVVNEKLVKETRRRL